MPAKTSPEASLGAGHVLVHLLEAHELLEDVPRSKKPIGSSGLRASSFELPTVLGENKKHHHANGHLGEGGSVFSWVQMAVVVQTALGSRFGG